MSDYYNGLAFRAIDSDAASDDEPMSAALEAQLANNHHYLHRVGGGSAVQLGVSLGTGQTDDNLHPRASYGISSIYYLPFLVTRGLTEIRLDWHGRLEGYDLDVRLVLEGFGAVDTTWAPGGSDNVHRAVILTLDSPAEYEFETELVLWQIGKAGALDGSPQPGYVVDGKIQVPLPGGVMSTTFAACVVSARADEDDNDTLVTPFEPLLRLIGTTLSDGSSGELAITTANGSGSGLRFVEAELARLAPRSIQLTQRHT